MNTVVTSKVSDVYLNNPVSSLELAKRIMTIIKSFADMLKCLNETTCSVLIPWLVWAGINSALVTFACLVVVLFEVS